MSGLADKAFKVAASTLGLVTVASAAYFGANAYGVLSHVSKQQKDKQQPQQQQQ
eukprot:CAMPEP_0198243182 /NCGR_PEP_ID=MMETSP1446-20131203/25261_1 /TAXON_ID=1461542 ORGANISM="Unidentified sp, Strain CCMP2111" /NCGR_SAMPLE_ID=MMETSP1446 /ASSEMBLY_ACC=CAM_ASM_001112 /LENGTH=53 /DNA_ID=CAMNT_0043926929 /DNA_START=230 /DNA_END=391 /DNA_ORIENTATION=-